MHCTECGIRLDVPRKVATVTCPRCGCVFWTESGNKFYPALSMHPVTHVAEHYALSKWMPTGTRPVVVGAYDVRFRHTEPATIVLWWNGMRFVALDGRRVDETQLLTWRGVLA